MNKRMVSIIRELSDLEKQSSLASLADSYAVSQRTVRNDLNAINDLLRGHHLQILQLEKGGQVVRQADFPEVLPYLEEKDFYDYKLSREERKKIASVLLLSSSGFITLSEMAEYMAVSRATVIHDLDDIKAYIQKGNMKVRSHPNKGLRVEGAESDKRVFLVQLLSFHPEAASEDIVQKLIAVEESVRSVLDKILYEQEHVHQSVLNDVSFQKIAAYLGIMTNRISHGNYIEVRSQHPNSKREMAHDILKYVRQYCHIPITEDEEQFLSELLSFARYLKQKETSQDSVKMQMAARAFIEHISEELGIELNRDYDFFENLASHLESTLSVRMGDMEPNAVVEKVVEENPEVQEAVKKHLSVIQQYTFREITEVETDYLVVHVCAAIERKKNKEITFRVILACHAGIGTSHLLMEKLKKHFNFQIVDIVSSHEAGNLEKGQADFVVSTVPLKRCEIEHITVSPLLKDEDYIRIGNVIDRLRGGRNFPKRREERQKTAKELMLRIAPVIYDEIPDDARAVLGRIGKIVTDYFQESAELEEEILTPCLYQLLPASHIQLDVPCGNWRQAVRASAQKLLELSYIEECYIDAMIVNIEENGPYIVISPGFALPHEGVEKGCRKLGMNLIRLLAPTSFGDEDECQVEFVCCLSAVDHKTHLKAFFHLVNLLKKEDFKEALRKADTAKEAAEIIRQYESNMEAEE